MKKIASMLVLSAIVIVALVGCGHNHEMAEEVIKEATCTQNGEVKHYCKTCDYNYIEKIESSHKYEKTAIEESTCFHRGKSKFTCTVCGDSYEKEEDLAPHNFENKYCTVCGERKIGIINTNKPFGELSYGATGYEPLTKCKISSLNAEMHNGIITVNISGTKTYDSSGENSLSTCYFTLIIEDSTKTVVYSSIVGAKCAVNQSFNVSKTALKVLDDSEDYNIYLKDHMS